MRVRERVRLGSVLSSSTHSVGTSRLQHFHALRVRVGVRVRVVTSRLQYFHVLASLRVRSRW